MRMTEFLAAVAGAVIGGLITGWWTSKVARDQWDRELERRRSESLDELIMELRIAAHDMSIFWNVAEGDGERLIRTMRALRLAEVRSSKLYPGLSEVLSELGERFAESLDAVEVEGRDSQNVDGLISGTMSLVVVACERWLSDHSSLDMGSAEQRELLTSAQAVRQA